MLSTYAQKMRMFSRDVRLYLVSWAIVGFNHMGLIAVLFNLYLLRLGLEPRFVGIVNGTGWFAFALFCLPAGAMGKRWSSRTLMIAGMSIVTLGMGLTLISELLPRHWQKIWILCFYVFTLIGAAVYFVSTIPFLAGATSKQERNHAFALRTALNNLSALVGSLVGGLLPGVFATLLKVSLDDPAPYRYPLWISAGMYMVSVLVLLRTSKIETPHTEKITIDERSARPKGQVAPLGLIAILASVTLLINSVPTSTSNFFNIYMDTILAVPTTVIGAFAAAKQLLGVLLILIAPLLITKWGKERIILSGYILGSLSLLPLALVPNWPVAGLGYVLSAALMSFTLPSYAVYHQESVTPNWRVLMSGAVSTANGLSGSVMAYAGAYIIANRGFRDLFLLASFLGAVGALLFWNQVRTTRKPQTHKSQ